MQVLGVAIEHAPQLDPQVMHWPDTKNLLLAQLLHSVDRGPKHLSHAESQLPQSLSDFRYSLGFTEAIINLLKRSVPKGHGVICIFGCENILMVL